jgi:hypothetical protein
MCTSLLHASCRLFSFSTVLRDLTIIWLSLISFLAMSSVNIEESKDRLSRLTNGLHSCILYFLPIDDAVTSILPTGWKKLQTSFSMLTLRWVVSAAHVVAMYLLLLEELILSPLVEHCWIIMRIEITKSLGLPFPDYC